MLSTRPLHDPAKRTEVAAQKMLKHQTLLAQVSEAVGRDRVVVVGMGWNPHVRRVRAALDKAEVAHTYLEFGNYSNQWRERLAIKMWSGWPTFPQIYVRGVLLGGADEVEQAITDGSLRAALEGVADAA